MIRIFDMEDGVLKVTEHCLMIAELKVLMDKFDDALPALKFVYLMTAPDSPYANMETEEKIEMISEEVGGEFPLDDEDIEKAIAKLARLYATPSSRFYDSVRKSIDRMSTYLENAAISEGRDGNLDQIHKIQANAGKVIDSFKKLEKIRNEELKVALRGKAQVGEY